MLARISECFGKRDVSIRSMVQQPAEGDCAELIFMTHHAKEADVQEALKGIEDIEDVVEVGTLIRIEED